jgi:DHA1 family bicyclomycin/chloramphenicol resistance-like MFS transporter
MLEQQDEDTGSASSLIGCAGILLGSVGMMLVSLDWTNRILAVGTLYVVVGLVCSLLWAIVSTKPFVKQLPQLSEIQ